MTTHFFLHSLFSYIIFWNKYYTLLITSIIHINRNSIFCRLFTLFSHLRHKKLGNVLWTEYREYSNFHRFSNHISPIFFAHRSVGETNAVLQKQRSDWYPQVILARALKIRKKIHAVLDMKYEMWRSSSIPPSSRLTRGFQLEGRDAPRGSERGRGRREEINASASVRFTFYIPVSSSFSSSFLPSLFFYFNFRLFRLLLITPVRIAHSSLFKSKNVSLKCWNQYTKSKICFCCNLWYWRHIEKVHKLLLKKFNKLF